MGIAIDILVALFVLFSFYRGWRQGFLFQLGQFALMIVGYFVAKGTGHYLAEPLQSAGLSPIISGTVGFFVVFFLVMLVGSFILKRMTRELVSGSEGLTTTDRSLGTLIGGAKGLLITYVTICGLIVIHQATGSVPIPFGSSAAGRWVMTNNFLDSDEFPRAKALFKLGVVMHTRGSESLASDPHVAAILAHPKATVLRTPEVIKALAERDFLRLMGNDDVMDFLDESDVQEHLNALEWVGDGDGTDGGGADPLHPQ